MLEWLLQLLANKPLMLWVTLVFCGWLLLAFAWLYKRNSKKELSADEAEWYIGQRRPPKKKPRSEEQGR
jgi:hypothetical protein